EYPDKIEDFQVRLSFDNAKNLIGEEIPKETIKSILASLEIKVNNVTETGLGLTVPAYRNDVQREADIIEEILRVYGYNNIGTTEKLNASISNSSKLEDYNIQNLIGNQLVSQGFFEIMSNSLTSSKYTGLSEKINNTHDVEILNPLSHDLGVMRQSMLFSGLEAIAYNINRKQSDLKLFEFGKTYHDYSGNREEPKHLSLFVSGNRTRESWKVALNASDFFFIKGVITSVLNRLGITNYKESSTKNDMISEGLILGLGKINLVDFGIVKKSVLNTFDISQSVLFADFNWDNILKVISNKSITYKDIPKYPEVRRDFALLLDESVTFDSILSIAKQTEKHLLKSVNLFDVYKGKNLPEGKKSYALSFILQDEKKTLTDKQIDKIMNKLQYSFEKQIGAELR
ncbi:MAG: phenylalanine--tRNA ligase subunit beta, partial [Bacteroidia bacterium]|nr:phenylalanine--tRNA ligase subunit beta [Bacteroidia bacterium]